MSYKICNTQFVWVKFEEKHGIEEVKNIIDDVNKKFDKEHRYKVLIDTRQAEITDKIFSITEVMSNFEKLGVSINAKTAVLRRPDGGKYQTVMKNVAEAGGHNFRLFVDFEKAVTWLNE